MKQFDSHVNSDVDCNVDRNIYGEAKNIKKQTLDCSTLKLLTQKKRSTSLPDLLSHQPTQTSLYSTKVSNNSGFKSSMYRKTHVLKNGESRNDKRNPERKIRMMIMETSVHLATMKIN